MYKSGHFKILELYNLLCNCLVDDFSSFDFVKFQDQLNEYYINMRIKVENEIVEI